MFPQRLSQTPFRILLSVHNLQVWRTIKIQNSKDSTVSVIPFSEGVFFPVTPVGPHVLDQVEVF